MDLLKLNRIVADCNGWDHIKIRMLKKAFRKSFSMKDMGPARQILGMHTVPNRTKRLFMAVTTTICEKGALEVQHGRCEAGRFDTTEKL